MFTGLIDQTRIYSLPFTGIHLFKIFVILSSAYFIHYSSRISNAYLTSFDFIMGSESEDNAPEVSANPTPHGGLWAARVWNVANRNDWKHVISPASYIIKKITSSNIKKRVLQLTLSADCRFSTKYELVTDSSPHDWNKLNCDGMYTVLGKMFVFIKIFILIDIPLTGLQFVYKLSEYSPDHQTRALMNHCQQSVKWHRMMKGQAGNLVRLIIRMMRNWWDHWK